MTDFELAVRKGRASKLQEVIKLSGAKTFEEYRQFTLRLSILFAVLFFLITPVLVLLAIPVGVFLYFLPTIIAQSVREEIERSLIPALYSASRLPRGIPQRELLSRLAEYKEFGLLHEFFEESNKLYVKSGGRFTIEESLRKIAQTVRSQKLDRVIQILVIGMKNNKDPSSLLLKSAEDLEDIQSLVEQKSAALATQKYILLISSGVLVPFVLGGCLQILQFFSVMAPFLVGFGIHVSPAGSVTAPIIGYLLIQAWLASFWTAAAVDEKPSWVVGYLPALTLSSLLFYTLGGTII